MSVPPDSQPSVDAPLRVRVAGALASKWSVPTSMLAALALTAPALGGGYQSEDWAFEGISHFGVGVNLWGRPGPAAAELARQVAKDRAYGFLPWITTDDFHVAFLRPLTALTHYLDYRVLGAPWLAHAQNLLFFAALVGAVGWLYRSLVQPRWAAGLATLLFAVEDAHGHPVGWISNRHAIIAALFSVLALVGFHRWRRDGSWRAATAVPLLLGAALASSELALGGVGYLLAYTLLVDRAPAGRRALASLAYLVPTAAWSILRRSLGYGVQGSGLYLDPVTHPLEFLQHAPSRAFALASGQLGLLRAGAFNDLESPHWIGAILLTGVVLVLLAAVLWPVARQRPALRFWALGSGLAMLPVCSAFPEDRLLLLVGVGAFAILAELTAALARTPSPWRSRWIQRGARATVASGLVLHGGVAPLLLPWRATTMARYDERLQVARHSAFGLVMRPGSELVLLQAPDYYFGVMMLIVQQSRELPTPERTLVLSGTLDELSVTRVDPNALELSAPRGLMPESFDQIYRGGAEPMKQGQVVNLGGLVVEVVATLPNGQPSSARVRFSWPLESEKLVFASWKEGRYVRWPLPRVGERVVVRAR